MSTLFGGGGKTQAPAKPEPVPVTLQPSSVATTTTAPGVGNVKTGKVEPGTGGGGFASLIGTTPTGLKRKAKTQKKSLLG